MVYFRRRIRILRFFTCYYIIVVEVVLVLVVMAIVEPRVRKTQVRIRKKNQIENDNTPQYNKLKSEQMRNIKLCSGKGGSHYWKRKCRA